MGEWNRGMSHHQVKLAANVFFGSSGMKELYSAFVESFLDYFIYLVYVV